MNAQKCRNRWAFCLSGRRNGIVAELATVCQDKTGIGKIDPQTIHGLRPDLKPLSGGVGRYEVAVVAEEHFRVSVPEFVRSFPRVLP